MYKEKYVDDRTEEQKQSSGYLHKEFGSDWLTNDRYKAALSRFSSIQNEFPKEVEAVIREKRQLHRDSAPFLSTLQPEMYNCILLKNNAFKELDIRLKKREAKFAEVTNDDIYQRQIKMGNVFAKKYVLSNQEIFTEETYQVACTAKQPDSYRFKGKKQCGSFN